ncbi:MAG: 30S ribosomal protein S8 [Candidatus Pacebacteria bacterium]|nr:30S ribosomal protein S8 [Candidatus Paceibacterota bacterium]PIR64046.1 MAG: 30S ribosomal protein S8 [Candidatus Pacebacteria bacterium CG10_big_fil_rev_8_21_14_0_10_40_26]PIZ78150.1 MAG: 30S ribosomal protein S8 [Candidatus Pacebacteria bacterium CG_4_10_14_0_2_um_filter_40_20]PJA69122.1 MAG: 30S ribosomal protein S8 [Candidatus Pacebacteria bacterium CG_4_9_14_3_um_filter_40_12]PJC41745.1 MAG: 30S ribosomal protein S8 [Candidatus Pacebacteria bacterium CG_4_9_14_0_2_um_filter_40_15]
MTDPIADFIIRIKNAHMARKTVVEAPFSKVKKSIADILVNEGYLSSVEVREEKPFSMLVVTLKYIGRQPAINDVKRLSKPGRRVYSPSDAVPKALGGYGITIVSTSKGVMTDVAARKANVGGELLCQIW